MLHTVPRTSVMRPQGGQRFDSQLLQSLFCPKLPLMAVACVYESRLEWSVKWKMNEIKCTFYCIGLGSIRDRGTLCAWLL